MAGIMSGVPNDAMTDATTDATTGVMTSGTDARNPGLEHGDMTDSTTSGTWMSPSTQEWRT
jgi:hypothetical protein